MDSLQASLIKINQVFTLGVAASDSSSFAERCDCDQEAQGFDMVAHYKINNIMFDGDPHIAVSCDSKICLESCSGLPPEIEHLQTETNWPVSYRTAVTVKCSEGRELRGDEVITCEQDTTFSFLDKPRCNEMGKCSDSDLFQLVSHCKLLCFDIDS